jgi:hypothetical protein
MADKQPIPAKFDNQIKAKAKMRGTPSQCEKN